MARNKYPEETVEKILTAAKRLFLEKGYEQTTIQDIVDQLGGLTKGAVYHHFKSKEEIMNAIGDKMFREENPFDKVRGRIDLSGLEKMKEVIRLTQEPEWSALSCQSIPLIQNAALLARSIDNGRRVVAPMWRELIDEGIADGSIHTGYPQEIAELLSVMDTLWLSPSVFPATREGVIRKFRCAGEMFAKMGVPLIDDEMIALAEKFFQRVSPELFL